MEIVKNEYKRFRNLSEPQRRQVEKQLIEHKHNTYTTDIRIGDDLRLDNFVIGQDVMRPDIMASKVLAEYIWANKELFADKTVIDMGCGSGILGIVACLAQAKKVFFTDFSDATVGNTMVNIDKYGLQNNTAVCKGDLFECIHEPSDIVIFNHPFFADSPLADTPVSYSMLDQGELLQRFFKQAKQYCKDRLILPFLHLAGEKNNPALQCKKFDYYVLREKSYVIQTGLQVGNLSIYEIAFNK